MLAQELNDVSIGAMKQRYENTIAQSKLSKFLTSFETNHVADKMIHTRLDGLGGNHIENN